MTTTSPIREKILEEINQLSDPQLNQILDFIHQINSKNLSHAQEINDPLTNFIGGIELGNLAENIDQNVCE